ncbi:hypothetical protein N8766_05165 [bacterium]|jgi:hypothetical protein|nr:hypothetical protein [bacterium]
MNDEFETHLSQQSLKAIPKGWRREILSGIEDKKGNSTKPITVLMSFILTVSQRPRLALGAIWILIAILNLTGPDNLKTTTLANRKEANTPSPALIVAIEHEFFKSSSRSEENSPEDHRQSKPQPLHGPRSQLTTSTNRIVT